MFAAGAKPINLNNLFITNNNPRSMMEQAELYDFPRSLCSWIKGLYTATLQSNLDTLIGVNEGDCSNTKELMEVLETKGIAIYEFSFLQSRL